MYHPGIAIAQSSLLYTCCYSFMTMMGHRASQAALDFVTTLTRRGGGFSAITLQLQNTAVTLLGNSRNSSHLTLTYTVTTTTMHSGVPVLSIVCDHARRTPANGLHSHVASGERPSRSSKAVIQAWISFFFALRMAFKLARSSLSILFPLSRMYFSCSLSTFEGSRKSLQLCGLALVESSVD